MEMGVVNNINGLELAARPVMTPYLSHIGRLAFEALTGLAGRSLGRAPGHPLLACGRGRAGTVIEAFG